MKSLRSTSTDGEADRWRLIYRISVIISILAGLATLFQVGLAGRTLILNGLNASIPAWLLIITAITSFLLGYGLRTFKKYQSKVSSFSIPKTVKKVLNLLELSWDNDMYVSFDKHEQSFFETKLINKLDKNKVINASYLEFIEYFRYEYSNIEPEVLVKLKHHRIMNSNGYITQRGFNTLRRIASK